MATAEGTSSVWFITGGSSGIGRELARQALNAGESVAVLSRKGTDLDGPGDPGRVLSIKADVRDEAAVRDAVEQAVARFGRIDVVANNAGRGLAGAVEETTDAQARALFDTNFFGALNVLRAVLPVLRRQWSGHILQVSGALGQTAFPGQGLLSATKHALEGVSDALALETAPFGITVTIVEPGPTATSHAGSEESASVTLPDYDQTVRTPQGDIPVSDAGRVATGIRSALASGNPPRRLALGTVSAAVMRASLDARLADLDAWAETTNAVDA